MYDSPMYDRLPHWAIFMVTSDTGSAVFSKGPYIRSYYSPSVAYQVDYVQIYPRCHPKSERTYRNFGTIYDDRFPTHRTYGLEERACQLSIRPERGRPSALLVKQAGPPSLRLEIVLMFRVAFDAVWTGAFYPLASYAGPERAGLIRSVHIENVQAFTAGADRNLQSFRVDLTERLAADPAGTDQLIYFAHALNVMMVSKHYVEYRGATTCRTRYL